MSGQRRLTAAGLAGMIENATLFRLVLDEAEAPVGYVSLRPEAGGWGVIEALALRPAAAEKLARPVSEWSIAWLRNDGRRRIRWQMPFDAAELGLARELGFKAGEAGVVFTRPVDASEMKTKMDERKAKGSIITFGSWR